MLFALHDGNDFGNKRSGLAPGKIVTQVSRWVLEEEETAPIIAEYYSLWSLISFR